MRYVYVYIIVVMMLLCPSFCWTCTSFLSYNIPSMRTGVGGVESNSAYVWGLHFLGCSLPEKSESVCKVLQSKITADLLEKGVGCAGEIATSVA